MSYHNTTSLARPELEVATRNAKSQDDFVMKLFEDAPTVKASASQIFAGGIKHSYWTERTPLTSIRRSVTNLAKVGKLIKLDEQRKGSFGMPESLYCLNPDRHE